MEKNGFLPIPSIVIRNHKLLSNSTKWKFNWIAYLFHHLKLFGCTAHLYQCCMNIFSCAYAMNFCFSDRDLGYALCSGGELNQAIISSLTLIKAWFVLKTLCCNTICSPAN